MLARRIASRYMEALFDLAQAQQQTDAWEEQLAALAAVFAATPDLCGVLEHPEIPLARKEQILRDAFGTKVAPEIVTLLTLLIRREHELDLATLHEVYRELRDAARQVVPVTVTSALPLSDGQRQALTQALAARVSGTIQLTMQIDPAVIAGLVVQIGDRVIDASARTTLTALRETMRGG